MGLNFKKCGRCSIYIEGEQFEQLMKTGKIEGHITIGDAVFKVTIEHITDWLPHGFDEEKED